MSYKYRCEMCGDDCVAPEGWTEEEALVEMRNNFGQDTAKEDCKLVCDTCYQRAMKGGLH